MKLVILESPYAGDVERNVAYARACMRDCLLRGEAPIASHLLYTQPGVLDDLVPNERALGIRAGLAWGRVAEATVVYTDLGITAGMQEGIGRAHAEGRVVYMRELNQRAPQKADVRIVCVDRLTDPTARMQRWNALWQRMVGGKMPAQTEAELSDRAKELLWRAEAELRSKEPR